MAHRLKKELRRPTLIRCFWTADEKLGLGTDEFRRRIKVEKLRAKGKQRQEPFQLEESIVERIAVPTLRSPLSELSFGVV